MNNIFEVTLKTINGLRDTAQGKDRKYLDIEDGKIYVLQKDIGYIFENYKVEKIEYKGQFFREQE